MFKCGVGINSKDNMVNGRGRIITKTKENYIDKCESSTRFHQRSENSGTKKNAHD